VLALAVSLALVPRSGAADIKGPGPRGDAAPLRIGLIRTLFRDAPESLVQNLMAPFAAVLEAQTGRTGELVNAGDATQLGRMLADGKVDLGVFHGIEFAWARQKFPNLKPLVIAVNQDQHLRAFVLVRKDARMNRLADLKGKTLAVPCFTREHCYVFVRRHCGSLNEFFGKVVRPKNVEIALDDLVDGKVDAVVADGVCLAHFKERKPGRFKRLRELARSEVFPATVIAYRAGGLDGPTLERFRSGLIDVRQTAVGRQLLTLWQLTGFEPVPADYDQTVTDIVKAYPSR
jgi:ABC-type phosphate/phosphonate transport system substrate-binding protein